MKTEITVWPSTENKLTPWIYLHGIAESLAGTDLTYIHPEQYRMLCHTDPIIPVHISLGGKLLPGLAILTRRTCVNHITGYCVLAEDHNAIADAIQYYLKTTEENENS